MKPERSSDNQITKDVTFRAVWVSLF